MLDHDGATAANIWHSLRQLFQSNTDARKNALHTELRNMVQGDAPVNLFCQRVKTIGDELRELGDTVSDSQLINIVVVGLSEDFDKQASFIPMIRPPPTFAEVRSLLQLAAETQSQGLSPQGLSCCGSSSSVVYTSAAFHAGSCRRAVRIVICSTAPRLAS